MFIYSSRNALQPVNRLPPEILSRIARDVLHSDQDARRIIPFTHVCRYWCESITSAPENWSMISSHSKSLAVLSLERSKSFPLEITLDVPEARAKPGFSDILKLYIQNTEVLTLSYPSSAEDLVQTVPGFPRSMPNLRSLAVLSFWTPEPQWDPFVDPFESLSPSLRYLSLNCIPLYPSFLNLRNLVEFDFSNPGSDLTLDAILTLLEENRSLRSLVLYIETLNPTPNFLRRWAPITNRLGHLSVSCANPEGIRGLISNTPLKTGADLRIVCFNGQGGLNDILSGIPTTHFPNLQSLTRMHAHKSGIRSSGQNGNFWFGHLPPSEVALRGLSLLSFASIQDLHLYGLGNRPLDPSIFPALKTLVIDGDDSPQGTLSILFSSPELSPSLKTLALLNCNLSEIFMESLAQFASEHKNTASAGLDRVVITYRDWEPPSAESIRAVEERVSVVEVGPSVEVPDDLRWCLEWH